MRDQGGSHHHPVPFVLKFGHFLTEIFFGFPYIFLFIVKNISRVIGFSFCRKKHYTQKYIFEVVFMTKLYITYRQISRTEKGLYSRTTRTYNSLKRSFYDFLRFLSVILTMKIMFLMFLSISFFHDFQQNFEYPISNNEPAANFTYILTCT